MACRPASAGPRRTSRGTWALRTPSRPSRSGAREISQWLAKNPSVKQWVVLDDINMSTADEERKAGTLRMTERMVQTHRMKGLNHEDAKAAVKILNGEKIAPWILKVQPTMELL